MRCLHLSAIIPRCLLKLLDFEFTSAVLAMYIQHVKFQLSAQALYAYEFPPTFPVSISTPASVGS